MIQPAERMNIERLVTWSAPPICLPGTCEEICHCGMDAHSGHPTDHPPMNVGCPSCQRIAAENDADPLGINRLLQATHLWEVCPRYEKERYALLLIADYEPLFLITGPSRFTDVRKNNPVNGPMVATSTDIGFLVGSLLQWLDTEAIKVTWSNGAPVFPEDQASTGSEVAA